MLVPSYTAFYHSFYEARIWFWVTTRGPGPVAGSAVEAIQGQLTNVNGIFPVFQHFCDNEHIDICSVLPLLVLKGKERRTEGELPLRERRLFR